MRHVGRSERGAHVGRILRVMVLMSQRAVTVAELSERFDVSVKTARRDIEMIEEAGIPVYEVDESRCSRECKQFRIDSHFARSIL